MDAIRELGRVVEELQAAGTHALARWSGASASAYVAIVVPIGAPRRPAPGAPPTTAPAGPRRLVLSTPEVADALGCSVPTVKNLIRSGALQSVKIGSLRRVRFSDLEAYVAQLDGPQ